VIIFTAIYFKGMKFFYDLGAYVLFIKSTIRRPEKHSVFFSRIITEFYSIGIGSFGIVSIISIFMGAVATIQIGYQLVDGLIPDYMIGRVVRDSNVLEFSPGIISLVLAGKVGSSIASEIGTMKVTEQIDAIEIMGINSRNFVVLPKIIAGVFAIPMLVIYSMLLSLVGGAISGEISGLIYLEQFVRGLRTDFEGYTIFFAMVKATVFAFLMTSISAFQGYKTEGGALEVGESSTRGVVISCVAIILFDYLISQVMLFK